MTSDFYAIGILAATLLITWLGWDEIIGKRRAGEPWLCFGSAGKLPAHIWLPALREGWRVDYEPAKGWGTVVRRVSEDRLVVAGNVEDERECQLALKRWLSQRCQESLVPLLWAVSREIGLPFCGASVEMQKARWASCSRNKTIAVNLKLLFLPLALVRYVFIQELCHTVHMRHSGRYWCVLKSKEPKSLALDEQLKKAWRVVPAWV